MVRLALPRLRISAGAGQIVLVDHGDRLIEANGLANSAVDSRASNPQCPMKSS